MAIGYDFTLYYRPGLTLSKEDLRILSKEIHRLGSVCLDPLPLYQVFSLDPAAFDDKVIVTAHQTVGLERQLVGFTSAVILNLNIDGIEDPVIHGGLTVIDPLNRQNGLPVQLFARLFMDTVKRYRRRVWLTSISELPKTLVHFYTFVQNLYPSPDLEIPSKTHLMIAKNISDNHRSKMLISSSAIFEEDTFVFRGSNSADDARCFRKNLKDPGSLHLNKVANEFYQGLLRDSQGDEVLQVGYIEWEHVQRYLKMERFRDYNTEIQKGSSK